MGGEWHRPVKSPRSIRRQQLFQPARIAIQKVARYSVMFRVLIGDLGNAAAVERQNLRARVPLSMPKPSASAIASRMVDLPLPFSPTKKVTSAWNSIDCSSRTAGMLNGKSSKPTSLPHDAWMADSPL